MQVLVRAAFTSPVHVFPHLGLAHRARCLARTRIGVPVRACAARPAPVPRAASSPQSKAQIRLIACDMDGTILDSSSAITAANVAAVRRLLRETDVRFVPATGKSRAGAVKAMAELGAHLRECHPRGVPGVFLQGLVVYGASGETVYEHGVGDAVARNVAQLADELQLALIAYSGDNIVCATSDEYTDLLPVYHEPEPRVVGDWENVIGRQMLNKFIFMGEPARIDEIRPYVQEVLQGRAVLTQAQSNMLEVLPLGSSKGDGVRRLLKSMDISVNDVMAIGDAENDLEMLKMVGISCAVSNALPSVKQMAKFTDIPSNDDSGVAVAIDRFIFGSNVQSIMS